MVVHTTAFMCQAGMAWSCCTAAWHTYALVCNITITTVINISLPIPAAQLSWMLRHRWVHSIENDTVKILFHVPYTYYFHANLIDFIEETTGMRITLSYAVNMPYNGGDTEKVMFNFTFKKIRMPYHLCIIPSLHYNNFAITYTI